MAERPLLILDTATRTPVVGLASADGTLVASRSWVSHHRHGEQLLEELGILLRERGLSKRGLSGVIVGTGPGSFTGLRIGLATAKVIAYTLDIPIVGVSTTFALGLASGAAQAAVTLPAGAVDRYVHRVSVDGATATEEEAPLLVAGAEQFSRAVNGRTVVAVDIDAPEVPAEPGRTALANLAQAMATLGTVELEAGRRADPANLVPAYVALPRGIARAAAEIEWSPDLR